jgi:hypothetical protein
VAYSHSVSAFPMQKASLVSEGIRVTGSIQNWVVAKESCGHGNKLVNKVKDPAGCIHTSCLLTVKKQKVAEKLLRRCFLEDLGGSSTLWAPNDSCKRIRAIRRHGNSFGSKVKQSAAQKISRNQSRPGKHLQLKSTLWALELHKSKQGAESGGRSD